MSADLTSIIERIERYCEALASALSPRATFTGSYAKAAEDYRAAMDELRKLNERQPLPDPLHDTEQAMSRGWR